MLHRKVFVLAMSISLSSAALAAEINNQAQCDGELNILKQSLATNSLTPKFQNVAKALVDEVQALCADKQFAHANTVADAARGMLARE